MGYPLDDNMKEDAYPLDEADERYDYYSEQERSPRRFHSHERSGQLKNGFLDDENERSVMRSHSKEPISYTKIVLKSRSEVEEQLEKREQSGTLLSNENGNDSSLVLGGD